jgi:hypothetical protein
MCEEQTIVVTILGIIMVLGLACRFIFMCEDE